MLIICGCSPVWLINAKRPWPSKPVTWVQIPPAASNLNPYHSMKITFDIMRSYRNRFNAAKEVAKELFKFELGPYVGQESKYPLQTRFIQNFILMLLFCLSKNYFAAMIK